MPQGSSGAAALTLTNVSKAFSGDFALRGVDLELHGGEVHALLGQNGSGKSTLIKVLAGYHRPEPGSVGLRNGVPFELGSANAAHEVGLRFIHQSPAAIGEFDLTDNLALGESYTGRWWLSDRRERRATKQVFAEYGIEVDPAVPLAALGPAQQTMTAIVRALHHGTPGGILILDEPTAALSARESERLFSLIRRIRAQGSTVLYVTHRLHEVFEIADRITVLRDGRRIRTWPVEELTPDGLVRVILGGGLESLDAKPPAPKHKVALEVKDLGGLIVQDTSLRVHEGEIVGVTGLSGSGVEELLHLIFGVGERLEGEIVVNGQPTRCGSPREAIAAGLAFAPGDRQELGGLQEWTVRENLTLPSLRPRGVLRWLSERTERGDVGEWIWRFGVDPTDPEARLSSLSGGNQQKVVLAKWLRCGASVFLLEEPTAGVDVGAKAAIYTALNEVASQGAAVLIASSDAEELASICDRVLVMRTGRIVASLEGGSRTVPRIIAESVDVEPVHAEGVV
jgi:ribose transport system ATP-binding protein